jgi:hypothetical protein
VTVRCKEATASNGQFYFQMEAVSKSRKCLGVRERDFLGCFLGLYRGFKKKWSWNANVAVSMLKNRPSKIRAFGQSSGLYEVQCQSP